MIHRGPWWSIAPAPSEPPDDFDYELDEEMDRIRGDQKLMAEAKEDADLDIYSEPELIRMHAERRIEERRERGY